MIQPKEHEGTPKLPPRLYGGEILTGEYAGAWMASSDMNQKPGALPLDEWLSAQEHEQLTREAIARTWEEAARLTRFYSPGDNIANVYDSKAKAARGGAL